MAKDIIFESEVTPESVTMIKSELLNYMNEEDDNEEMYYANENSIHLERGYSLADIAPYETDNCNVYMNTHGGCAYSGLGLASFIEVHSKRYSINALASGIIASAGIPIFVSAKVRLCYPHTQFLYHTVRGGAEYTLQDKVCGIEECNAIQKTYDQIIVDNSYLTQEQLDKWKEKNVNIFISAKEALEYGLVDEIIGCDPSEELVSTDRDFVDADGVEYTLI